MKAAKLDEWPSDSHVSQDATHQILRDVRAAAMWAAALTPAELGECQRLAERQEKAKAGVAEGKSLRQVARELGTSKDTVARDVSQKSVRTEKRDTSRKVIRYEINSGTRPVDAAARVKRDAPEIAARVEAGDFRSMRAVAKAAGIIREKTRVEGLCRPPPGAGARGGGRNRRGHVRRQASQSVTRRTAAASASAFVV